MFRLAAVVQTELAGQTDRQRDNHVATNKEHEVNKKTANQTNR